MKDMTMMTRMTRASMGLLAVAGCLWLMSPLNAGEAKQPDAAGVPGCVSLLAYYSRQGTWQDSMRATREAAARRQAELVKAGDADSPWPGVSLGPWWAIPLSAKPLDRSATVTDVPFPPEQGPIDVTKPCGGLTWTECPDLKNRKGTGYLFRVIRAAEPMAIAVTFTRSSCGTVMWLNGRKVFRMERSIHFTGGDHNLRLNLTKGENQLLIKMTEDATGGSNGNIVLKPVALWGSDSGPTPENPLNPVWNRLSSDFPDAASRRQMLWEREDGIWDGPWAENSATPLAQRYATAAGKRSRGLAGADGGTIEAARSVYYRACRFSETERFLRQRESLRLAIEDLIATYGPRYPKGAEYLASLDALCKAIEVKGDAAVKGDARAGAAFDQTVDACLALRHEALLANPLLDFKQLLLVKRFCSYRGVRGDNGVEPGQPVSWACHASLNTHGWENEIAVLSPVRPDGKLTTLYRPEGTGFVGDVDLNWDADRLIFSGIREPGRWQIFEIGADGRGVHEFIRQQQPDVDNFDACYLPDGGIVFNSTATMQAVPCSANDRVANLYRTQSDGNGIRRLCFDQDQDYTPCVANDGRILYTRWEYADVAHCFARLLFTMNPDGTNQMSVYKSNSYWPPAVWFARAIPNHPSKVAAIVAGHHGGRRRGALVIFDTARGQYEADGAVHMIGKGDAPIQPVFQDSLYSGGGAFGAKGVFPAFLHPYPLSDKYLLTAGRLTANSQWAIYLVDVFGNILPVYEDPEFALYEPIPLRRTPRPPVIPDRTQRACKDATVLLTDVYQGPGLRGVPRGTVKQLRVYSYVWGYHMMARYGAAGAIDGRRILGTVPVESDGSACFRVPANTPLAVQPLDAEGRALQVMRSWYTAMPGERASCIGCHERFSDTPTAGKGLSALKPPVDIQPWNGPVRPYGFAREVAPVLQRRCSGCHEAQRGKQAAAGPSAPRLGPEMLRQYVRNVGSESDYRLKQPGEHYAESSELVQMLRKGHHGVAPDREEFDRLITWIDLNTPISGTWSEGGAKGGCGLIDRRRELDRCYAGLDLDIEAYPGPPPQPVTPILPEPEKPSDPVVCPNWPFGRAEAERRQKAAGAETRRRVELGRTAEGKPIQIELALVPAGEFVIGDPKGLRDERPAARARIAKAFWMARCEISNEVYALFDAAHDSYIYDTNPNSNPSAPGVPLNQPGQPVVRISWREAMAFCRWLSEKTGERFTLPTEGQWEWACRAGTDTPLWFGGVDANYAGNANVADQAFAKIGKGIRLTRVFDNRFNDGAMVSVPGGKYAANAWGLHDMHGNVGEWTLSAYRPYPYVEASISPPVNTPGAAPRVFTRGEIEWERSQTAMFVIRGGSWHDRPFRCRSAFRNYLPAWMGTYDVGFRVVASE